MHFYFYICLAIFLWNIARGCYVLIADPECSLYEGNPFTSSEFWVPTLAFSIPFVNILMFTIWLYFYVAIPSSPKYWK